MHVLHARTSIAMSMNVVRSWYVHGTLGQNDWNVLHVLRGLMFAPKNYTCKSNARYITKKIILRKCE